MAEALLDEIRNAIAPGERFELDDQLAKVIQVEASRLPKRTDVPETEQ